MREVIFEMPETYGKYRVLCQFGYHRYVNYAWWGYLQKQRVKKPLLWGKPKIVWDTIDECWWSKEMISMDQLKEYAIKFYDENIELPIRVNQRAMSLK